MASTRKSNRPRERDGNAYIYRYVYITEKCSRAFSDNVHIPVTLSTLERCVTTLYVVDILPEFRNMDE